MREHRVLQMVFGVGLGVFTAGSAAYVYLYGLLIFDPSRLGSGLFAWLRVSTGIRGVGSGAAVLPILVGLCRILTRPRSVGGPKPIAGLVLSIVGTAVGVLPLAPVELAGPAASAAFVLVLVAGAVGGILFLAGLAMMVLWDPVLAWEPVPFPPPMEGPGIVK